MTDDAALSAALAAIAERGAIGERSLPVAIAHADQFTVLVPRTARRLVDLGSGGGLPGLVVAVRCPWLQVTLVERRTRRADLLRRAVRALALDDRVTVLGVDVRAVAERHRGTFDVVTARSFAAPAITAHWAGELLVAGGLLIVSEPPSDDADRWPEAVLELAGLFDQGRELGVRRFVRR
ncbi:MAG: RsmG family class I SAM-dependent methyltransferase [Actinomycetota bacterium]